MFADQEICSWKSDYVAAKWKCTGFADVHKQCPLIINVRGANFSLVIPVTGILK